MKQEEAMWGCWRVGNQRHTWPQGWSFLKGRSFLRCSTWALIKQPQVHVLFLILQGQVGFGVEITLAQWATGELVCRALSVHLNRGKRDHKESLWWVSFVLGHFESQRYVNGLKLWMTDPFFHTLPLSDKGWWNKGSLISYLLYFEIVCITNNLWEVKKNPQ